MSWKHGTFGCFDVPLTCAATYCCPCIQYGMTARALGQNFCGACLFATCCPVCPTFVQRQMVAKKHNIPSNTMEDLALSCCCGLCTTVQNANQMAPESDIQGFKAEFLFQAPTSDDMKKMADEAKANQAASSTENPLHKAEEGK